MSDEEIKYKSNWVKETTLQAGAGIYLEKAMLGSKAFVSLTGAAKQILLEFYMRLQLSQTTVNSKGCKDKKYSASNNGKLVLRYDSLEKKFGYSSATIRKTFKLLLECGFIEIVKPGCGYARIATEFALITNWRLYGKPEFKPSEDKAITPARGFHKRKI